MSARQSISFASPLGPVTVTAEAGKIVELSWNEAGSGPQDGGETPLLCEARSQLQAYFDGSRRSFELPLAPAGSAFQKGVWNALLAIPYGQTRSYGEIAAALGGVARAVGGACGANPIPIIIPCHRVLAGGGRIGGFSASGGVRDKRWLLDFERGSPQLPFG
jgi:methylated-DNA-[protein]-cysteine S-methyltransferase